MMFEFLPNRDAGCANWAGFTEHPGRVRILPNGKLEIVVERDDDLDQWMAGLRDRITAVMNKAD